MIKSLLHLIFCRDKSAKTQSFPIIIGKSKPTENIMMDHLYTLTNRESEVLYLLAEGWSNQQIAEKLCLTIRTVKFHTGNIYSKLGLKCRSEAIAWAWHNGEIQYQSEE